jgi:hypothetical protein
MVSCELRDLVADVVQTDGFGTLPLIHNSPFTISLIPYLVLMSSGRMKRQPGHSQFTISPIP